MSTILEGALGKLNEKLAAKGGLGGTLKFDIKDEGFIVVNDTTATLGDGDAQCTLKMNADTFTGVLDGTKSPTTSFMMGKVKVEGDMNIALKLSNVVG